MSDELQAFLTRLLNGALKPDKGYGPIIDPVALLKEALKGDGPIESSILLHRLKVKRRGETMR